MSATAGSPYRGRQTRGGRIVLRCADDCGDLALEEWELQRLLRGVPTDLARALRPGRSLRDRETSFNLSIALGQEHPAHGFFFRGWEHGGFNVGRA